jgi:hypothetical protein
MDFGQGNIISFNYSSDRGVTWSPKITVGSASQFPMPVTLPNGNIILTYYTGNVVYRRSTDGGATWAAAQTISSISNPPCPPDNAGCSIWRMNPIPANSVNPLNGSMVVAWTDGRTGNARIYYSRSTNSGASWSAAAPLAPSGVAGTYQVEPWVASDEAGIFHAIWYDDRENPNTSVFNIYYSQSTDDGATWSNAVRITTATSDLRIGIPTSYAGAAGDYINVTASHGNVYAVWTDTRQGSGEDVYVVRGTYGGAGTPTATVTGTPPTATQTSTQPPATVTPTFSPTPCALGPIESFETGTLGVYTSTVPVCTPGGCGWSSVTTAAHTGSHSAFAPDVEDVSDQYLTTINPISVPPGVTLSFWQSYSTESTYDGGVLEFSTNGGSTWTDGGALITMHPYEGPISTCCSNPLSGRQAWNGDSGGFVETRAVLAGFAGQNLSIRFRLGTDAGLAATGWWIDDVAILTGTCGSVTPQPTATGTNTPTVAVTTGTPTSPPLVTNTATLSGVTGTPTSQATATSTGTPPTPLPTVTECPISFSDVPVGSTFYTWIKCLACRGIINGYPDGTFRPNNNVTRGQLSKIVSNSAGFSDPATQMFEDVPPGSTFFDYIGRLASRGYISGYPCGGPGEPCVPPGNLPYFRPNTNATRGQISKIVSNAAGFIEPVSGQTFEDVPPGSTFYDFIERLASRDVMSGYPCGSTGEPCIPPENRPYFRPNNNATRGQTSKIVANTFFPACTTPAR